MSDLTTASGASRCCSSCKTIRDDSEFGWDKYRCLSCVRSRIRRWRASQAKPASADGRQRPSQMAAGRSSERSQALQTREVVVTEDLSRVVSQYLATRPWDNQQALSGRARIDRRTLREILRVERETTSLQIADRLCVAMGTHLSALDTREVPVGARA